MNQNHKLTILVLTLIVVLGGVGSVFSFETPPSHAARQYENFPKRWISCNDPEFMRRHYRVVGSTTAHVLNLSSISKRHLKNLNRTSYGTLRDLSYEISLKQGLGQDSEIQPSYRFFPYLRKMTYQVMPKKGEPLKKFTKLWSKNKYINTFKIHFLVPERSYMQDYGNVIAELSKNDKKVLLRSLEVLPFLKVFRSVELSHYVGSNVGFDAKKSFFKAA